MGYLVAVYSSSVGWTCKASDGNLSKVSCCSETMSITGGGPPELLPYWWWAEADLCTS